MRGRFLSIIIAVLLTSCSGCARFAGFMTTAPPNRVLHPALGNLCRQRAQYDSQFDVVVGPPRATLRVSMLEGRPFGMRPRGTVVVLHGIFSTSERMFPFATSFAHAGYRTVFVDLRAHGNSSGLETTYGVLEARDLSQVLNDLDARGLLVQPVGVCGHSLGGSTAIQLASRDWRVQAVVAMSAHVYMAEIVRQAVRTRIPVLKHLATDEWIAQVVHEAGKSAGFDPRMANSLVAMQQGCTPVLLIHGTEDRFVLPYHSVMLRDAAPQRTRLILLHGADHTGMLDEIRDEASQAAVSFFQEMLSVAAN